MIIHHQNNVAAFAGAHVFYWMLQPLFQYRISVTTAAAAITSGPYYYLANLERGL